MYEKVVKRGIDMFLSFCGLLLLSWLYLLVMLIIMIDDPGPVFFKQKRVGRNNTYFQMHKFRTMKADTPHEVPTHLLDNPRQYITKVGGFMRKYSIDELPQLWDILVGNMSIVGPRPALWNQEDLIAEREKYGANDVRPGLTGWAQINGRDELEIHEKAKLDGEYAAKLKQGGFSAFAMDCKCFFSTLKTVVQHEGVIEGGTGAGQEQK